MGDDALPAGAASPGALSGCTLAQDRTRSGRGEVASEGHAERVSRSRTCLSTSWVTWRSQCPESDGTQQESLDDSLPHTTAQCHPPFPEDWRARLGFCGLGWKQLGGCRAQGWLAALVDALLEVVRARTATVDVPVFLCQQDVPTLKTSKLAPMVDGLFPASERALVLAVFTRSVVFLGPDNIEQVLRSMPWLHTG